MTKITVIGESCVDKFVYCDALRLAPDVPVPVLRIQKNTSNSGMAMNVFNNISVKVSDVKIITNDNWKENVKIRYMHWESNHMFFRVDEEKPVNRIDLSKIDYNCDIIVISDYDKGFLTESDIKEICQRHPTVFLDTKKFLGDWAGDAKFIKINNHEYKKSEPFSDKLINKIIRTVGSDGCIYQGKQYYTEKVDVKDSSGAGDTFISALAIDFLNTKDIEKSIMYANSCATEVVKHKGVTTI